MMPLMIPSPVAPGRLAADTRGAAAIEFALVAAPFIALLVIILQTAVLYFAQQGLETVAEQSVRSIVTGQAQSGGLSQTAYRNQVCAALPPFMTCSRLMIDVRTAADFSSMDTAKPTITYDNNGNVNNSFSYSTGGAGSIVMVRLMYRWPVIRGPLGAGFTRDVNGEHILVATEVAKNEPYAQ